jgi:steroid delta-isomerase-like uncharacterized protein
MVSGTMSTETERNLGAMRNIVDAWNSHELERIAPFFAQEFENHQAPLAPVIGLEAYLAHCAKWFEAFPDFRMQILTLVGDGAVVCLESSATGTHTDQFFEAAPSGGAIENRALDIFEFASDGLVARERGYWDFSLLTGRVAPRYGGH